MAQWAMRGIRGATVAASNEKTAIVAATREMVEAAIRENAVEIEDIASIIFTVTDDLNAEFPAVAAREAGLTGVPLLCSREIAVPGAQARCIRLLLHVNTERSQREMRHVYLGEARSLRPDLS